MSFTRLAYDKCNLQNRNNNSMNVGQYNLDTPVNCGSCYQVNPQIINQGSGISMNANTPWRFGAGPVDVESELRNINRPATNCPSGKYQPKCDNCGVVTSGEPCGNGDTLACHNCGKHVKLGGMCNQNLVDFPECDFPVENTRLSNPPSTLRGTGWNRFEELCLDPQAKLFLPQGILDGMTRMAAKDNFKPCYRTPRVNGMNP